MNWVTVSPIGKCHICRFKKSIFMLICVNFSKTLSVSVWFVTFKHASKDRITTLTIFKSLNKFDTLHYFQLKRGKLSTVPACHVKLIQPIAEQCSVKTSGDWTACLWFGEKFGRPSHHRRGLKCKPVLLAIRKHKAILPPSQLIAIVSASADRFFPVSTAGL